MRFWPFTRKQPPTITVVMPGQSLLMLTPEEMVRLEERWTTSLRARGMTEQLTAITEIASVRAVQKQAELQSAANQERPGTMNYQAGYAAAMSDLVAEVLQRCHSKPSEQG